MVNHSAKFFSSVLLLITISFSIKGQTILNGIISSDYTLTLANSPYQVTGNLLVYPNVTVTVEPGVVVKFNANIEVLLRGKLIANGTLQDTILFSSNILNRGSWAGIVIDDYANAKVECSYLKGRFAYKFIYNQRRTSNDTTIKMTHCVLDSNEYVFNDWGYINNYTIKYIDSCIFSNNSFVGPPVNTTIKNSLFYGGDAGLRNIDSQSPAPIIDNCIFHNFTMMAVGDNCIVTNSTFHDNALAIEVSPNTILHYNNIYNNTIGIESYALNPTNQITQNRICNNGTNVKLFGSEDFNAFNNCWCLTDSAQIRHTMNDFFTTSGLGIVNYTPFDSTCSFLTNVQNIIEANNDFQIYPNPTSDNLFLIIPTNISKAQIKIFNVFGQLAFNSVVQKQNPSIDVSALANGIYIVEVAMGGNINRQKFIKQ